MEGYMKHCTSQTWVNTSVRLQHHIMLAYKTVSNYSNYLLFIIGNSYIFEHIFMLIYRNRGLSMIGSVSVCYLKISQNKVTKIKSQLYISMSLLNTPCKHSLILRWVVGQSCPAFKNNRKCWVFRSWVMQQDNKPKHRSILATEWLRQKNTRLLERPSPDLSPTEMLWHDLRSVIHSRHPKHIAELKRFCKE